jgi:hypothetical protein
MAEPDHIFVKPLPNLAHGDQPAAFPFFYIKPTDNEKVLRKFFPKEKGPVSNIDPIGNSPVIIQKVYLFACQKINRILQLSYIVSFYQDMFSYTICHDGDMCPILHSHNCI